MTAILCEKVTKIEKSWYNIIVEGDIIGKNEEKT